VSSFAGGADLLHGGNTGVNDLTLQDVADDEFEWLCYESFDETSSESSTASVAQDDQIIRVGMVGDCEGSAPYIIPHGAWKKHWDPNAKDGEYRFVQSGHRYQKAWNSVRHYAGAQVVQLEVEAALTTSKKPDVERLDIGDRDRALDKALFWRQVEELLHNLWNDQSWIEELLRVFRTVELNRQKGIFPTTSPEKEEDGAILALPLKRTSQTQDDGLEFSDDMWSRVKKSVVYCWEEGRLERDYKGLIRKPDDDEAAGKVVDMFKIAWRERLQARKKRQLGAE